MKKSSSAGARSRSRELVLQALYQAQITGHDHDELCRQFQARPDYERVEQAFFDALLAGVCEREDALKTTLEAFIDRPVVQLDPVELSALLIGVYELEHCRDIPYRAVINEAVNLAHRFGAEDGHKFVNAVLDKAARALRPDSA